MMKQMKMNNMIKAVFSWVRPLFGRKKKRPNSIYPLR